MRTGAFAIYVAAVLARIGVSLVAAAGLGIGAVNASAVSPALGATKASAVSLAVKVVPSSVHPGGHYTVSISGRYDQRALARPPYLLAFVQYSPSRCRTTATAEYKLPQADWDWDYQQHAQAKSPFRDTASWAAGPALGTRRVCAYLYAQHISPRSTSKPLVRASASFTNTAAPSQPKR